MAILVVKRRRRDGGRLEKKEEGMRLWTGKGECEQKDEEKRDGGVRMRNGGRRDGWGQEE